VILTAGIVGGAAAVAPRSRPDEGTVDRRHHRLDRCGRGVRGAGFARYAAKQRVGATLEIESGCNDPMAVFLTLVFIEVVRAGDHAPGWSVLWEFVWQFGLGGLAGVGGGRALVWLLNRVSLTSGLYPLLAMAGAGDHGSTTVSGGSGFLAIYLAGLVLGTHGVKSQGNILKVHDGLAWLSQINCS
jgi:cell volume regulation protein A